jgi:hypothetical protein
MLLRLPTFSIARTLARFGCLVLTLCAGAVTAAADSPSSASPLPGYAIIHLGRGPFNRMDFAATVDGVKGAMVIDTGATSTMLNDVKYAPLAGLLSGDILAANGAMIDIGTHNLYFKHAGASAPAAP